MKMRKKLIVVPLFCIMITILILPSCLPHKEKKEERLVHLGIDAEIVNIDAENEILTITGIDYGNTIFPEGTRVDCSLLDEGGKIFKMKSLSNTEILHFSDLKIADKIKINVDDKELNKADTTLIKIEQIEVLDED